MFGTSAAIVEISIRRTVSWLSVVGGLIVNLPYIFNDRSVEGRMVDKISRVPDTK
jgi:hypothetical protein